MFYTKNLPAWGACHPCGRGNYHGAVRTYGTGLGRNGGRPRRRGGRRDDAADRLLRVLPGRAMVGRRLKTQAVRSDG